MKIDIIHPAHYRDDGSLVQSKKWYDRLGAYLHGPAERNTREGTLGNPTAGFSLCFSPPHLRC